MKDLDKQNVKIHSHYQSSINLLSDTEVFKVYLLLIQLVILQTGIIKELYESR